MRGSRQNGGRELARAKFENASRLSIIHRTPIKKPSLSITPHNIINYSHPLHTKENDRS
jgi:hypothetical protein